MNEVQNETSAKDNKKLLTDFLITEYNQGFKLINHLHVQKLAYQKIFIGLVATIGTISIIFLQLKINSQQNREASFLELQNDYFKIEKLVGVLLLFSTIIGIIIIRNLVAIRRQEVYFNNSILYIREIFKKKLGLNTEYVNPDKAKASDRRSADYFSILLGSLVNLIMFCASIYLIIVRYLQNSLISYVLFALLPLLYIIIHLFIVEFYLNRKITNEK